MPSRFRPWVRIRASELVGIRGNTEEPDSSRRPMNIQQIPVSQIVLDERNPRVAHIMEGLSEGNVQDLIPLALGQHAPESEESGSSTTYSSLKASIRVRVKAD